jgi:hypothetical protein
MSTTQRAFSDEQIAQTLTALGEDATADDIRAYGDRGGKLPESTFSAGQMVVFNSTASDGQRNVRAEILRPLTDQEADLLETGPMYKIRTADGSEQDAFVDELSFADAPRKMPVWTAADCAVADEQGWNLFNIDNATGRAEIQRDDEVAVFSSDDAAIEFVQKQAKGGDVVATKALQIAGLPVPNAEALKLPEDMDAVRNGLASLVEMHANGNSPVFRPELSGYAGQAAAKELVENWNQALLDDPSGKIMGNLIGDVDDTIAALKVFRDRAAAILPARYQPAKVVEQSGPDYTVSVELSVTADSPEEAARYALDDLRDRAIEAWKMDVECNRTGVVTEVSVSGSDGQPLAKPDTSPSPDM